MKVASTDGERLHDYIVANVHGLADLGERVASVIPVSRRARAYGEFLGGGVSIVVALRLVRMARRYSDDPVLAEDGAKIRQRVRQYVLDKLNIHPGNCVDMDQLVELAIVAANASGIAISHGVEQLVQKESGSPACYLCGKRLDYHSLLPDLQCVNCERRLPLRIAIAYSGAPQGSLEPVTYDHVWPKAYGGNNDVRNVLPSCMECNGSKRDLVSWHLDNVLGQVCRMPASGAKAIADDWTIQESELNRLNKISMAMRVAWDFAKANSCSLKEAHLKIGPFRSPLEVGDEEDSADYFNVRTHDFWALGLDPLVG